MIAEPGITSISPWNSDLLLKDLQSDIYKTYINAIDGLDMGFPLVEFEVDRCRNLQGNNVAAFSSSGSPSSASSECSEELSFDLVWPGCDSGAATIHIPDHDYLNTSLNLLDGQGVTVCPEEFDWGVGNNFVATSLLDNVDSACEDLPRIPGYPRPRWSRSYDPVTDTKLWTRMSLEERLEAVEGLTNIISNQMGLREQVEIINIIVPGTKISPTDTEFVIDLNLLDDQKLCSVREYVRQVQAVQRAKLESRGAGGSPTRVSSAPRSPFPASSTSIGNHGHLGSSTAAHHKNERGPSLGKGKQLKKEVKQKRALGTQKVIRQRPTKKEQRQQKKERRSGLFQKEEVLSLSVFPVAEEDVDIDILD